MLQRQKRVNGELEILETRTAFRIAGCRTEEIQENTVVAWELALTQSLGNNAGSGHL